MDTPSGPRGGEPPALFFAAGVAALAGLLFGYDTAVVNGAIDYLQEHFGLSAALHGWAASSALIGCIPGAAVAGMASDRLGPRRALAMTAALFFLSAVFSAVPQSLGQFVWARFVGGVAVGAASMLAPLYLAEISPARMRGRVVALYQLAIVSGILLVFFVNLWIQNLGAESWNVSQGWRWMFGSEALPALLFGILLACVPESPRWLIRNGRESEGRAVFARIAGPAAAEAATAEVKASLEWEESGRLDELFRPPFRRALIVGVLLAVFQQLSGINVIMYYSTSIFASIGEGGLSAFFQTVLVGVVNLLFTLVALAGLDRWGRRPLLLAGIGVQLAALSATGLLMGGKGHPLLVLTCILVYIAAFAASSGPVVWVVIAEIFPNRIRGRAMSVATLALWAACYGVAQTFPVMREQFGSAATFGFYAVCSGLSLVFAALLVPETKNRTLEEIEASWIRAQGGRPRPGV